MQAVIAVYQNRALAGGASARHAGIMIDKVNHFLDTGTGIDPAQSLPLQVWKFGSDPSLRLALTGGELVSGYAVLVRNLFGGADNLLIGGYANEVPCYIPSDEILAGLNYEGGRDPGSDGVAGGSLMWYGCGPGHFLAGPGGVESTLVQALQAMLA
jgi:neutral ceramidase